ncbi:MAG: hypothetical protein IID44_08710 [Planctomycetes bacterium]|nr:hypothetical protein [Planctomycetota bacterium]
MIRCGPQLEQLEKRLLLTVGVALNDAGDLVVDGDASGDVAIVADGGVYTVSDDDGDQVVDGEVTGSIRIALEGEDDGANDNVTIDLGGGSVQNVSANLGEGDNSLSISNGSVSGRLSYRGGDGSDDVTIDVAIGRGIFARLGGGDNSLTIRDSVGDPAEGEDAVPEVGGGIIVSGGDGNDTVTVDEDAAVARLIFARLGGGDNTVNINGDLGSSLVVHGRGGADTLNVSGNVGRSVTASLGDGDNSVEVGGDIGKNLTVRAGDGNDTVTIAEGAAVGRNVNLRLGGGENTVTHEGATAGNLLIRTDNAEDEDRITIADDSVEGEIITKLGQERFSFASFFERLLSRFRGRGRGRGHGGDEGDGGEGDGGEGDGGDGGHRGGGGLRSLFEGIIERFRNRFRP